MKQAIHMVCNDCGQTFDLLNSYWPKPEANSRWLHSHGVGHEHYTVHYADGTVKRKTQVAPSNVVEGKRFSLRS